MKKMIMIAALLLTGCASEPTPTSVLTPLQSDIQESSNALRGQYKFKMSILADPSQSAELLNLVDLICKNLENQTPVADIESALIGTYGVVGAKDLIKLSKKHQCP